MNQLSRTLPLYWNDLRQHNINNWEVSVLKNTEIWPDRGVRLQFRLEMLNAFNRTWFANPDVNPARGNFGRISGQSNQPRVIQSGLKFHF